MLIVKDIPEISRLRFVWTFTLEFIEKTSDEPYLRMPLHVHTKFCKKPGFVLFNFRLFFFFFELASNRYSKLGLL